MLNLLSCLDFVFVFRVFNFVSCPSRHMRWKLFPDCVKRLQSTPDNSNLQGKSKKKVRVIWSSKKIAESKVKNSFYCTVNILITFNCRNVK